jgi:kynurenine formamidase
VIIDLSLPLDIESPDFKAFVDKARAKRVSSLMTLGHHGTHLDRLKGSKIPTEYFKSRGLVYDVRARGQDGRLTLDMVDIGLILKGDFLLLRTGVMEGHAYGSEGYMSAPFEMDWELLNAVLDKGVRFIGLDARGLRADSDHPKADTICETRGAFVIENLSGLDRLPTLVAVTIYAAVFDFGGSGLPVKVLAEIEP